ncbi:MAG: cytochrome o ubiquinol oxidase subunit III [Parcubacteria group bacterium 21-54-25]|nr:MAG: cytochrome o ubiquinol oxidase subunit III [Parcubacteria group bacterium 21-54-25]HQU07971.1 cytochrome o ubiquinol oxidase subunit III [Candidatus Paceibacterota bacterium]
MKSTPVLLTESNDLTHTHEQSDTAVFGFWIYIMSDTIIFACLFATYAVLHNNTFGGPGARELFNLPFVLTETLILLTSSFTAGLGILAAHRRNKPQVLGWFIASLVLGLSFLALEFHEFSALIHAGHGPSTSAFLSAYFVLVGTHGLHVAIGALWMVLLLVQVARKALTETNVRRLTMLSLFWHFLDVIWILIFTIVYLMAFV